MMSDADIAYLTFNGLCPFQKGERRIPPPPATASPLQVPGAALPGSHYHQWFVKGRKLRRRSAVRSDCRR